MTFAVSHCKVMNYRFGYEFNYHVSTNSVVEQKMEVSNVDDPTTMFISPIIRHNTPSSLAKLFFNAFKIVAWEEGPNVEHLICKQFQHKDVIKELFCKFKEIVHLEGPYVQLSSVVERFYLLYGLYSNPKKGPNVDIQSLLMTHIGYIEHHIDDVDDLDLEETPTVDEDFDFTELFQNTIFVFNHVRIMENITQFMVDEKINPGSSDKVEDSKRVNMAEKEESLNEDDFEIDPINHEMYCHEKIQDMDVILLSSDMLKERKEYLFGNEVGPTWRQIIESTRTGEILPKIDETPAIISNLCNDKDLSENIDHHQFALEQIEKLNYFYAQKLSFLKAMIFLGQQG